MVTWRLFGATGETKERVVEVAKALLYKPQSSSFGSDGNTKLTALLDELSERGTLDKIQLLLESASVPVTYLLERLDTESGREKIRDIALLLTAVGKIDVAKVDRILSRLLSKTPIEAGMVTPSYLSVLKRLNSSEVRRGIFLLVELLYELGRIEIRADSHV